MSIEAVDRFLQKVSEDISLQEQLVKALDSENELQAATDLGAKHGYIFTSDELNTEIHSSQSELQQMLSDGEISEQELEAVAGGGVTSTLVKAGAVLATPAGKITKSLKIGSKPKPAANDQSFGLVA